MSVGRGSPSARPEFATPPPDRATNSVWFVVALSVAVIAAAVAGVIVRSPDRAEAVVLRHTFTQGQTRTYDFSIEMNLEPVGLPDEEPISGRFTATMTMTMTTVEVREDGSAVVDLTISNVAVDGLPPGETPFPGGQETTARMTIASDGRVLSVEGEFGALPIGGLSPAGGGNPADKSTSQFLFPTFPSEGVAPGETWTETHEFPLFDEETKAQLEGQNLPIPENTSFTVTMEGRHDGFEDTSYGRAAKIHQQVDMPMDIEFPFGLLFASIAEGFGEAFGGLSGEPVPTPPPGLADAVMVMQGQMTMDADSVVLLEDADLVRMDGTLDMDMRIEMRNFPPELSQGQPTDVTVRGTMTMRILRTS